MSTTPTPTDTGTNLSASTSNNNEQTPAEEFITYPSLHRQQTPPPEPSSSFVPVREQVKNRLYVGNLHPSVDEYTLLQVFAKFGKISKLDFLFHKSGPSKGKPRGYAFVEYADKDDALKGLVNAHDKLLRGRKLVVTYANQAPLQDDFSGRPGAHGHRRMDNQRPTALSLLKSQSHRGKTEEKIAALEAKLRQMEKSSESSGASTLPPPHHSLPLKPPPEQPAPSFSLPKESPENITSDKGPSEGRSPGAPSQPSSSSLPESSPRPKISTSGTVFSASTSRSKQVGTSLGVLTGKGIRDKPTSGSMRGSSATNLGRKPTIEELVKQRQKARGGLLGK